MANGWTKFEAMSLNHRASVVRVLPAQAFHSSSGARAADPGVIDAKTLEPSASHGATVRSPVRRTHAAGARRRGVSFYGYEANAGRCHPPGRDPYSRHER